MKGDSLRGHLDLLVLQVVADSPMHGYAIIEELKRRTDQALDLPEGTLYPVLHRLEREQLLEAHWSEVSGRRRKSYRLTRSGASALHQRRADWRAFSSAVESVLGQSRLALAKVRLP